MTRRLGRRAIVRGGSVASPSWRGQCFRGMSRCSLARSHLPPRRGLAPRRRLGLRRRRGLPRLRFVRGFVDDGTVDRGFQRGELHAARLFPLRPGARGLRRGDRCRRRRKNGCGIDRRKRQRRGRCRRRCDRLGRGCGRNPWHRGGYGAVDDGRGRCRHRRGGGYDRGGGGFAEPKAAIVVHRDVRVMAERQVAEPVARRGLADIPGRVAGGAVP